MGSLKREWGRGEGHQKEKGGRCFGGSIGRRALKEKMGEEKDKEKDWERGGGHSEGKKERGRGKGKELGEGDGLNGRNIEVSSTFSKVVGFLGAKPLNRRRPKRAGDGVDGRA